MQSILSRGVVGRISTLGLLRMGAPAQAAPASPDNGDWPRIPSAIAADADMIKVQARGYSATLAAGAQTVMAARHSWHDVKSGVDYGKMHGSHKLLTGVLKHKIGFDGFVVSDWNGIGQVPGCSDARCAQAINAGIDMVRVPEDWRAFIANTRLQVERGDIPLARIDDAVTRILRVKLGAGLFLNNAWTSRGLGADLNAVLEVPSEQPAVRVSSVQINTQQDAKRLVWTGPAKLHIWSAQKANLLAYRDAALVFDLVQERAAEAPVSLTMACGSGCAGTLNLNHVLAVLPLAKRQTLTIPLACFAAQGVDLSRVDVPFSLAADAPFTAAFANIRVVAGAARAADAIACKQFTAVAQP
ncbi:putative glycoside hydrolase [Roseateles sp.]|uniref:putative glycoside hydrolase n=1 Tax=Roseateles sp. TaxID=1971397 RepID=UPI00286CBA47|nr:putative glycoside hydrolase [Roseateles sp.]